MDLIFPEDVVSGIKFDDDKAVHVGDVSGGIVAEEEAINEETKSTGDAQEYRVVLTLILCKERIGFSALPFTISKSLNREL